MDFIKKFAEEQLEKQMGGGQQQQQHNQGQSQGDNNQQSSYGDNEYQNQSSYGGQGQGQGFGQNQNQGYGQEERYGQEQGGGGGGFGVTGGSQYNAPHGSGGASSFGGSGGVPQINKNEALQAANQHAGNGNENASMFSQAFGMLQNMRKDDNDVDEQDVQEKHDKVYNQGQGGNMSANAIGSAAAMQAVKMFTSGGSGASQSGSGQGDMVSKIIGMAISEAAKMFDQSGGAASGNKQDAVNSAGQTVMKLLLKNQVSGMMGGGNSGGLSQLMGMASKFM